MSSKNYTLPADRYRSEFKKFLNDRECNILIIHGRTGTGKTITMSRTVYHHLMEVSKNRGTSTVGVCTQPRVVAAVELTKRICQLERRVIGHEIGYHTRPQTRKGKIYNFVTEGILLQQLIVNPGHFSNLSVLVLDEIHERSIDLDLLLQYIKHMVDNNLMGTLKVILMSATVEIESLKVFLTSSSQTPLIIKIEGSMYNVEMLHLPLQFNDEEIIPLDPNYFDAKKLEEIVPRALEYLLRRESGTTTGGHILVFLPTIHIILRIKSLLDNLTGPPFNNCKVFTVFRDMEEDDKYAAINYNLKRKIILSTDICESSITIEHVKYVMDSHYQTTPVLGHGNDWPDFRVQCSSKAASQQRRGRTGRTESGLYLSLTSAEQYSQLPLNKASALQTSSLQGYVLRLAALRLPLDSPCFGQVNAVRKMHSVVDLMVMGALPRLNAASLELTEEGKLLVIIPTTTTCARAILTAKILDVEDEVINICAMLEERFSDVSMEFNARGTVHKSQVTTIRTNLFGKLDNDFKFSEHYRLHVIIQGFMDTKFSQRDWAERRGYPYGRLMNVSQNVARIRKVMDHMKLKPELFQPKTKEFLAATQQDTTINNYDKIMLSLVSGFFTNLAYRETSFTYNVLRPGSFTSCYTPENAAFYTNDYSWVLYDSVEQRQHYNLKLTSFVKSKVIKLSSAAFDDINYWHHCNASVVSNLKTNDL